MTEQDKKEMLSEDECGILHGGFKVENLQVDSEFLSKNTNCKGSGFLDNNTNCTGTCKDCITTFKPTEPPITANSNCSV